MNQVLEAIEKRSSTRGYSEKEISKEILEQILKAGLQAPTATNRQEIHFSVVKGDNKDLALLEEEKNKSRGITNAPHNFYYEAPVLLILSAEKEFKWSKVDAGIAVENMSLAAESLGLGSLIIGCVYDVMHGEKEEYFNKAFSIPEGYGFEIALAVGYKAMEKVPHEYDAQRQISYVE